MERFVKLLALGFHRLLLILLLIGVAIGSFVLGPVIGLLCSYLCLVLVVFAWTPHTRRA
jgi:hypothetical protein